MSLILFGGMGLLAVLGMAVIDRMARQLGETEWAAVRAPTSAVPFAAML